MTADAQGDRTGYGACALCGRADQPPHTSLTTLAPRGQPGGLRGAWACRRCATAADSYAALVRALLRRAAPEVGATPATPPRWETMCEGDGGGCP